MSHHRIRWAVGMLLVFGSALFLLAGLSLWNSSAEAANKTTSAPSTICGGLAVVTTFNYESDLNHLNAIVAVAPDNIWAVGDYYDGVLDRAMIQHWNGTFWAASVDGEPGNDHEFYGITAFGANNVWAVGSSNVGFNDYHTLVEHWDGTSWTVIPSPNPNTHVSKLNAIGGASPNDIWAVGYSSLFGNASHDLLIEHWNGASWTLFPLGTIGTGSTYLSSISIVNASDIWAGGLYQNGARDIALALHWNGTVWQVVPTTNPGTIANDFTGVAVLATNNVWGVGAYRSGSGYKTLIERWNGATWDVIPSPNPGATDNFLNAISAYAANDIWAVGEFYSGTNYQTMVLHWDGFTWASVPSVSPGSGSNDLFAVTALGPTDVWAVGDFYNPTAQTLAEHYTGCPPTPTSTPTISPTPIPACPIEQNYTYSTTTNGMAIADTDIGNHGDDAVTNIELPFSYAFYNQPYDHANISSNGTLQFVSSNNAWVNSCLPMADFDMAIMPYWDDLETLNYPACPGGLCGIYTKTFGSAPNRIFVIEWRTVAHSDNTQYVNFEVQLYESSQRVDFTYGSVYDQGNSVTIGVQKGTGSTFTQFACSTASLTNGLDIIWGLEACTTPTPSATETATETPTATSTSIPTETPTNTATPLPTQTPGGPTATPVPPSNTPLPTNTRTNTPVATSTGLATQTATRTSTSIATLAPTQTPGGPTPTICPVQFTDVLSGSTFYSYIRCLACRGIINGYPDGTFRPNNDVSRGQLSKIVSNSAGFVDLQPDQKFQDVPVGSTFHVFIGRLAAREYINGYPCGGPGEPCVSPANLPYFRPASSASRGQISKIDSNAARYSDTPTGQQFEDVQVGSTYYTVTYRLVSRDVMQGYPCGGLGEPCGPDSLPYFRPNSNATRGQTAKIVSNTFFPNCQTPGARK